MFADECEDLAYEVAFWMQGLDDPGLSLDEHGRLVVQLGSHLRSLAIMALLAFGKTDRFHHNLIRSGRLRRDFLNRCVQLGDTGQHDFVSGMLEPLHDSLAAADWGLARQLTETAPAAFRPGHEYEDDFCVSQLLRQLLAGTPDPAAWGALLQRTERALGGPDHPRLLVCRAIGARDQSAFDAAFDALVQSRIDEIEEARDREPAEPPVLAQRAVFVEGLAMLQLARRAGLSTEVDYRLCPSLARVPMVEPVPED